MVMKKEPEEHIRRELLQNVRTAQKSIRKVEKEY